MPKHMIDEAAAADMSPLQARLLATYMNALEEQDDAPAATVTAPVPPPPEEEADAPAPQRTLSRSDLYARTMGDLLLKGWRMLGENCPETGEVPLMQHPVNGRKFSIATGRYTDEPAPATAEAERGPLFSATPTPKPESTPPPALPPAPPPAPPPATRPVPPPAAPAAVRESDEWCETMSKLMLQGWKMLNETCPVTGAVPLMGHPRNGRKFSVAIGKFVDEIGAGQSDGTLAPTAEEGESPAKASASRSATEPDGPQATSPTRPALSPSHKPRPVAVAAADAQGLGGISRAGTSVPMRWSPTPNMPSFAADAGADPDARSALDTAAAVLSHQMASISAQLASAPMPPPRELFEAISQCAEAMQKIESCRRLMRG